MPYHPIAAFGLLYGIGLLLLLAGLALAGVIAPVVVTWMVKTGIVNVLPIALVFGAARQSALLDGRPLFCFETNDAKAHRQSLKKHMWLWALSFGLAGVIADLASVAVAATVQAEAFHYSMMRLLVIAVVYAFIAREGIKSTFGPNAQLGAEPVQAPVQARKTPIPVEDRHER